MNGPCIPVATHLPPSCHEPAGRIGLNLQESIGTGWDIPVRMVQVPHQSRCTPGNTTIARSRRAGPAIHCYTTTRQHQPAPKTRRTKTSQHPHRHRQPHMRAGPSIAALLCRQAGRSTHARHVTPRPPATPATSCSSSFYGRAERAADWQGAFARAPGRAPPHFAAGSHASQRLGDAGRDDGQGVSLVGVVHLRVCASARLRVCVSMCVRVCGAVVHGRWNE